MQTRETYKDKMLYLATSHGLYTLEYKNDQWVQTRYSLKDQYISRLCVRSGQILAGTKAGVFRSQDLGCTWEKCEQGIGDIYVRALYADDDSGRIYLGTEPAAIYFSDDGGQNWKTGAHVETLRDKHNWSLPYSSEAGCIRGFAVRKNRCYAAAEQGGVLRSDNGGENWDLVLGSTGEENVRPDGVHFDVHQVYTHSSSPDNILACTGGGLYKSADGGDRWEQLYDCYCRAAWMDPQDRNHIIFGPADSVDRNGRIEASEDSLNWQDFSKQLPTPWSETMVELISSYQDSLFAITSDGRCFITLLEEDNWMPLFPEIKLINDLLIV